MSVLEHGLETHTSGAAGWTATYNSNFEKLDEAVGGPLEASKGLGTDAIADAAAATASALTDSTGGTVSQTINDVGASFNQATLNNNFASVTDEIDKLIADNAALRSKLNAVLSALRITGGCGVLDDNP